MTATNVVSDVARRLIIGAALVALAGCATSTPSPRLTSPERGEEIKSRFALNETADLDGNVRDDFDKAMTHLENGQYLEGTRLLHGVIQRAPRHTASHINLAVAYQRMNNLTAAEDSIKRALELNPEHPAANTEYGLIFRRTGRFVEARAAYERALRRDSGFVPARKNLGILCDVYIGDLECALEQYRLYSKVAPDENTVRIWIADLEKRLGKTMP